MNVESPISLRIVTCGSKKGKVCPTHGSECLEVVVASQPGTVLEGRLCFVSRVRRNPPYPKIFCCVFSGARMCIGQVNFPSICLKPSHIGSCASKALEKKAETGNGVRACWPFADGFMWQVYDSGKER